MGCWIQGVTMQLWMLILCVSPTIVTTITISSNGNSPEAKMASRMEVASAKSISAMNPKTEILRNKQQMTKSFNSTQLAINERYRRLIPYMTFYYANDIAPTTESYTNNVEVEKAEILEAGTLRPTERQPKVIYTQRHKDIPRYQGNRLTQFNIASSNPNKLYYKNVYPVFYQQTPKQNFNYRPEMDRDNVYDSYMLKPIKAPSVPFSIPQTRKPFYSLNQENIPNVQHYSSNEGEGTRYKLVPYEQTPPVTVENAEIYKKQYGSVNIPKEPVYVKERAPMRPYSQSFYDNQELKQRKPPTTVSEVYYERRPFVINEPVIESGFQPLATSPIEPTEVPVYTSTAHKIPFANFHSEKLREHQMVQPASVAPEAGKYRHQYDNEQPLHQNEQLHYQNEQPLHQNEPPFLQNEQPLHQSEQLIYQTEQPLHHNEHSSTNSVALADLLNSLQINKSIPKPITRENVGASIRTLLQVLNTLRAIPQHNEVETGIISTPKPFETPVIHVHSTPHTIVATTARPQDTDIQDEPLLAPIHTPSQHLDEYSSGGSSSQRFPLPITSDEEGGTPGKPGVDYPILTIIPETSFNCKTQRYKGFFADPETRCQVWHYCDLNGGQASFLCPNGTIFSQAALTCDWWFNVRCSSTTQLYVLNESLYKYILPHSPKFPEDYSGPLVDKYLTLKFKEMEEQFRKNKNKKVEKMDDDDEISESKERDVSSEESKIVDNSQLDAVSQADVMVESPVSPTIVTTITISSNGNSPEAKMASRMEAASAKSISAMNPKTEILRNKQQMTKSFNSTQLAINERYRRLIPYMTFYYANDIAPTTESYTNNVEVEKAEILEAGTLRPTQRQPKVIYTQRHKDIPRYQGNRLTQFNIASSNPNKLYYKNVYPVFYQQTPKQNFNYRPEMDRDNVYDSYMLKPIKAPSVPFSIPQTRKPFYSLNQENIPNVQHYSSNEGEGTRYKLVPYEQTPPVTVENAEIYKKQYGSVNIPKEPVYVKERAPMRPYSQSFYDNQELKQRKPPTTVSEVYYERRPFVINEPVIESGFQPLATSPIEPTEVPVYTSTAHKIPFANFHSEKLREHQMVQPASVAPEAGKYRHQYDNEQPLHQNEQLHYQNEQPLHQNEPPFLQNEQPLHQSEQLIYQTEQPLHHNEHSSTNSVALADLLNSLQINKSIPKPITRENVGASIRTLLQVLNTLRAIPQHNEVETGIISTPKPFETPVIHVHSTPHTIVATTARPQDTDIQDEPLLAPIHTPSQHLDEYSSGGSSSQRFPLPITSDEEGGTPGKPGVDYPILTIIPETSFNCKTQRYKGFFADPETRCQVWHYCDLNGGQASFLCPNGTIFSQAALTCDWWFNVRCSSTTQLYVLNESLYKYILPHSPKFPEDYSGPLVDKYLTLKFKEMEEQFRKNKNKKVEKMDDDDEISESKERDVSSEESKIVDNSQLDAVSQADVMVESPVSPTIVTTITISSNGNSPEAKMASRMEAASAKSISAMNPKTEILRNKQQMTKSFNSTQLAINERYRRLIPYMTFYYANDIAPTTESYTNNVEVEKAEILEAGTLRPTQRQPKVIYTQRHKDIPRYQGNRLTQFNIASSNPNKLYYKNVYPVFYQQTPKQNFNYRPEMDRDNVYDSYMLKPIKAPSVPFSIPQTRKPFYSLNQENIPNVQHYSSNEGEGTRYKLVPYEQTPPVTVENAEIYKKQYGSVNIPKEPVYVKERAPMRPYSQSFYDNQELKQRKPPTTVSEVYYERRPFVINEPVIESGFQPLATSPIEPTEVPVYTSTAHKIPFANFHSEKLREHQMVQPASVAPEAGKYRHQYDNEQPLHQNEQLHYQNEQPLHQNEPPFLQNEQPLHQSEQLIYQTEQPLHHNEHSSTNSVALADLLNSLQINKSIPKPITRENVGASIRTLLQVLNTLRAIPQHNEVETGIISTPKPFETPVIHVHSTPHTIVATTARPQDTDIQDEPLLAPIHTPSQHLDEYSSGGSSSQRFPLPITSDEEGGTPGKPGVDYPILTIIPETSFNCKTQRYKGFFADPETRCQVWHYCDLNGGQASFLCPNGTIFSQAALTCDWWFNVRCSSTTQLYVLNESLYKYILPHSPKFPEDYSGPLVDKYLTLKFKEMEEQFRKNKNKKVEKMDDDDEISESKERDVSSEESKIVDNSQLDAVSQADVMVESPGNSGNVQRLQDE